MEVSANDIILCVITVPVWIIGLLKGIIYYKNKQVDSKNN